MNYTYTFKEKEYISGANSHTVYSFTNGMTKLEVSFYDEPEDRWCGFFSITPKKNENVQSKSGLAAVIAKMLSPVTVCRGSVTLTDGIQSEILAESGKETHEFDELEEMDGCWNDFYYSVLEADKEVRKIAPGLCILQREEDLLKREKKDEKEDEITDLMISDFLASKGLPEDYECKSDEEFLRMNEELETFKDKWNAEHFQDRSASPSKF